MKTYKDKFKEDFGFEPMNKTLCAHVKCGLSCSEDCKARSIKWTDPYPEKTKMTAEETIKRGIEYCKKHRCYVDCPLINHVCINEFGEFFSFQMDFTNFAKEFNFMISELYKEE